MRRNGLVSSEGILDIQGEGEGKTLVRTHSE
jgi:hypothetical protein